MPYIIAKFLRPHQREGVQFVFECIAGMRQQQHPDVFTGFVPPAVVSRCTYIVLMQEWLYPCRRCMLRREPAAAV